MGIIEKLTFRYMKKNKKRTKTIILGIIGTMMLLTVVNIFANTFLQMLQENVIAKEGEYHAVFHNLTIESYEKLKASRKIKSCTLKEECLECVEVTEKCALVEMPKVNRRIFAQTQKLAKEIDMEILPLEMQTELPNRKMSEYNVTYHMELLEYYGISEPEQVGIGMLVKLILLILVAMGSIVIYNGYAISVFEKLKYLGTIGSIGASKWQKAKIVYLEGLIEGMIGVPTGIIMGVVLAKVGIHIIGNLLLYEEQIEMVVDAALIIKLVLLGFLMILSACLFPAIKAMRVSSMDLISHPYSLNEKIQEKTNLMTEHRILGIPGMLAIKNVWIKKKNYMANGLLIILVLCLLLDGITAMRGVNGDYYPKDDRERPELDLWMELYTKDEEKIQSIYNDIAKLPYVNTISLERELDINCILVEENQLQNDLKDFAIQITVGYVDALRKVNDMSSGEEIEGYYLFPTIIGLDDHTFTEYVKKAGYQIPQGKKYPVLIEDHVQIQRNDKGEEVERRSILSTQPGGQFSFLYSRYGDITVDFTPFENPVDEVLKGEFYLIGTTEEAPPIPYFSGRQDDITGYQERVLGQHHIYMAMRDFEKLLKDPAYRDTYGEHPKDTKATSYDSYKAIPTILKFSIDRRKIQESDQFGNGILGNKELVAKIAEDKKIEQEILKIVSEAGLLPGKAVNRDLGLGDQEEYPENNTYYFGSYSIWQKEQYFHSEKFLILLLGHGIIILIVTLLLTNIFQSISMSIRVRKREFAIYQSMGMTAEVLQKMLMMENAVYGLVGCIIGIPISFILLREVYLEFARYYELDWTMPWDLVPLQVLICLFVLVLPMIHTKSQMKHLNVIESIRDENI